MGEYFEGQKIFKASEITNDIVEKYKASRSGGKSAVGKSRINRELSALRKVLEVAIEFKEAKPEILQMIKLDSEPKPDARYKVPNKEQITAFLEDLDLRYYPLAKLTLETGMRAEETRHLLAKNITRRIIKGLDYYIITVTPLDPGECKCCEKGYITKSYRYRDIPISRDTFEIAQEFIKTADELGIRKDTSERQIWGAFKKASDKAGIEENLTLHPMRHCYASYLFDSGIKLATIKDFMGHSDVQTTMRYIHAVNYDLPMPESLLSF